jgi:hypothetical protein
LFVTLIDEVNDTKYIGVLARVNENGLNDVFAFVAGEGVIRYVPRVPSKENAFQDDKGNYPYPYYTAEIDITEPEPKPEEPDRTPTPY